MIEVEYAEIGFAAIDAGMGQQKPSDEGARDLSGDLSATPDDGEVMLSVLGVVAPRPSPIAVSADILQTVRRPHAIVEGREWKKGSACDALLHVAHVRRDRGQR